MIFGQIALTLSAFFTGAAFYINFAEHPARLKLMPGPLLTQWKPSYKRGFIMQSLLAILSGVSGFLAFYQTSNWLFIAGAIIILANWPFTLIVIMPLNKKLQAIPAERAGPGVILDLNRWGRLHAVRTGLSFSSPIFYLLALQ